VAHRTYDQLAAQLDVLRQAPTSVGTLDLVVRRPTPGEREILDEAVLNLELGLVGDSWLARARPRAIAEGRHLTSQINVMSSRMVGLLADTHDEQALAGDQLYVDLDISHTNLPAGCRLAIGDQAVLEVMAKPHTGCAKFTRRFGEEAVAFVNSELGREMRLRGLNARVVTAGTVRPGDKVVRIAPE
jgi:MOSC domain-containing protein